MANLAFYPWLKRGVGASVDRVVGTPPAGGGVERRSAVTVNLTVTVDPTSLGPISAVELQVPLVGPGDVAGLDTRTVTRTWPKPDVTDVELGFFPLIEFGDADLPWRYTPARVAPEAPPPEPAGPNQLFPWLALAVLREDEFTLEPPRPSTDKPGLPVLVVKPAAGQALPRLVDSWAWAHVQVSGEPPPTPALLSTMLSQRPDRALSRLVCPRKLAASTPYTAFLVPAFRQGRHAGLGEAIPDDVDTLAFAWDDSTPAGLRLPVYFHWRFHTGTSGGFRELVRKLVPRQITEGGDRALDITDPGDADLRDPARDLVHVEGALRPLDSVSPPWDPAQKTAFGNALKPKLDAPAVAIETGGPATLAPPLYGEWYAGKHKAKETGAPPWFDQVNLEPQHRVPAALGTEVVQRNQQALLASAWKQADGLNELNQAMQQAQLAREAAASLFRRLIKPIARFERLFHIVSPIMARLVGESSPGTPAVVTTIQGVFNKSPVPLGLFEGQWRRMAGRRSLLGRRQGKPLQPLPANDRTVLVRTNRGELRPDPPPPTPSGAATPETVGGSGVPDCLTVQIVDQLKLVPADQLLFWSLIVFFVGRSLALSGQSPFLARKLLLLGLTLVEAASAANGLDVLRTRVAAPLGAETPADVDQAPKIPGFVPELQPPPDADTRPPPPLPPPGAVETPELGELREALKDAFELMNKPPALGPEKFEADLGGLAAKALEGLDPGANLRDILRRRLPVAPTGWNPSDPLEPVQAAPDFPQPMYQPLADLSLQWILPGLGSVPDNTIGLLEPNQGFIEAYMLGVNHEMGRELLWHEYPTDQRGTYFRQFWDVRGLTDADDGSIPAGARDIEPIHTWAEELGEHGSRVPAQKLVLLLRGELVRRYPHLIVYMVPGTRRPADNKRVPSENPAEERYPLFTGSLGANARFYGFDKGEDDLELGDGFYFILQEPPAEQRFGLALDNPLPPDGFASVGTGGSTFVDDTASEVACAAVIRPNRLAVFGTLMLPPQP